MTLAALGLAEEIAIEAVSIVSALRAAKKKTARRRAMPAGSSSSVPSRDPDLPVLVVEDLADLVGLLLALTATVLVALTGAAVALDAIASYLIGLVLAGNAVFLAREMASLVLGEAALPEVERAVMAAVGADGIGPAGGGSVQVVHLGPTELLVVIGVAGGGGVEDGDSGIPAAALARVGPAAGDWGGGPARGARAVSSRRRGRVRGRGRGL